MTHTRLRRISEAFFVARALRPLPRIPRHPGPLLDAVPEILFYSSLSARLLILTVRQNVDTPDPLFAHDGVFLQNT